MNYQDWRTKHAESGDEEFTQRGEQARDLGSSEAPAYKPSGERESAAAAGAWQDPQGWPPEGAVDQNETSRVRDGLETPGHRPGREPIGTPPAPTATPEPQPSQERDQSLGIAQAVESILEQLADLF
jgi:hypothetical protein